MRIPSLLPTVFIAGAAASAVHAQEPRVGPRTIVAPGMRMFASFGDEHRAVIGLSTTSGSSSRDTLGVLVERVREGSPAEKAGIEEGNRIASVNAVSLRLSPADIGDDEMAGVMARRLSRELDKLEPGDEIDLRVLADGQTKSVKIKTVASADLNATWASFSRAEDRATLGINLAVTGSKRDTLGVFVLSVDESGPAEKAGIEEGSRIASINGVDVRAHRSEDDDDFGFRASNVNRLEREIARAKPGDDVDLRVYSNGQYRTVKVKAARMSDLPRHRRSVMILGGDNFAMPRGNMAFNINTVRIGDEVRHALESAKAFSFGRRVDW